MDRQELLVDKLFMSYSYRFASNEFATLCQSQIELLTNGLGAESSAIYLAEEVLEKQEENLLLFLVGSNAKSEFPSQIKGFELLKILEQLSSQKDILSSYCLPETNQDKLDFSMSISQNHLLDKQMILPLIYDDVAMGLLLVVRNDRTWDRHELDQIKLVSHTLAVACFFEKQSQWYQSQLRIQQDISYWNQQQIGNLLHQLKNPLTALRTFSKLLIKKVFPEERNYKIVKSILREGDHLASLIEQFSQEIEKDNVSSAELDSNSRLLSGEKSIDDANSRNFLLPANQSTLEHVDLAIILEPLLLASSLIAQSQGLEFSSDLDCNSTLVLGNANALGEVFSNILDNAIKYTPSPGQIRLSIEQKSDFLGIAIADTGFGISKENQQYLFTRYYRGSQTKGSISGTGLGLAIAKQLVVNMGGEIEVISPNPDSATKDFPGTIMIVWLRAVTN